MTTNEKVIAAIVIALAIVLGFLIWAGVQVAREFDGCIPSVVTERRDGMEVTTVECKP